MLLRRNSVQALFNGYYHDDSLAALQAKNPAVIEEHIPQGPSVNSSTTHEPSNNNSGINTKQKEESSA
jgi:hypothetical protein